MERLILFRKILNKLSSSRNNNWCNEVTLQNEPGGMYKWQKIMRVKTRQKTIRLIKLPTAEMQWTARTVEKTAQRTLPETAQRTKLPMHMMHTTKHRMIILTDTKENCR